VENQSKGLRLKIGNNTKSSPSTTLLMTETIEYEGNGVGGWRAEKSLLALFSLQTVRRINEPMTRALYILGLDLKPSSQKALAPALSLDA
jgi:hypothetical protein